MKVKNMEQIDLKRTISIVLMLVMLIAGMSGFAFATDSTGVAQTKAVTNTNSQTTNQTKTEAGNKSNEVTKSTETELIKKYGTYKGKNATRIPVITYHMVLSDKAKKKHHSSLSVSKSTFDKQMKYLKNKGYRTINCDEFYLWYKGKIKLPKKSVLITFDDGHYGVVKYALPILKKYNMKGTSFIIGASSRANKKGKISYNQIKSLQKSQSNLEFQSHTYSLHKRFSAKGDYKIVKADAAKQKKVYDFDYLAYPYGRNTKGMRKAYKDSGIKLAFTYGKNGYATRKQNIYQIRRIKISGSQSFAQFKRWFR